MIDVADRMESETVSQSIQSASRITKHFAGEYRVLKKGMMETVFQAIRSASWISCRFVEEKTCIELGSEWEPSSSHSVSLKNY